MCLLIRGVFTSIRSLGLSYGRCVYSSLGEFTGIKSPEVSNGRCDYSSMEILLVSGIHEFHMEDVFTHPRRVYWYQKSRSFIWKMCLPIHEEFTGIRNPGVSYGRCVYSSMERLLVSGVQEFHMQEAFTHPWRVYWYQESRSSNKEALTMESLLVSGAQKFHMEDAFTHPWNLLILRYESLNYLGKECLLTLWRLLEVLTPYRSSPEGE